MIRRHNSGMCLPCQWVVRYIQLPTKPEQHAGPNEVLVSSTLRDLVIGSGLEFEERGTHALKGVPGEWHLFAVASP
jgi:class 3 adenylate cyclase